MHVGASVKMYGCEECDHFFVDVSTYYNHMRRRHGKIMDSRIYCLSSDLFRYCFSVLFGIEGLDTAAAKKMAKLIQPNGSEFNL